MRTTTKIVSIAALGFALLGGSGARAADRLGAGVLEDLIRPHNWKAVHYSSYDRTGGNADFHRVAPGETLTLMDHKGAGILRRWWITIAPFNNREIQRQTIVRCYWDGETTPSVEVPVADFFGMGFGEYHPYISLPLNMTSGGYNSYWAMPFKRSARITVENRSKVPIAAFYYNIDLEGHDRLPNDVLYFHAQFRRTKPTRPGQPVTILETTGRGQYVGTLLSMQMLRGRGLGFLEGDERVFIDGEKEPSIIGTGTEDYFSSGWYYNYGVYSAPYHGVTIKEDETSRINSYRWHIEDPIPFQRSIKFDIEHGGINDVTADYTSVAYWYQTHPRPRFPPLPSDLMPTEPPPIPRIADIIEGERLQAGAKATSGNVTTQDMSVWEGVWSGYSQLWWQPNRAGEQLTLRLNAPAAGDYNLTGYFTQAPDYGNVAVHVNGRKLDPVVRGYAANVRPTGPISFGRVSLKEGANQVVVETVGKEAASTGFLVGIDGFVLKPVQ